MNYSFQIILFYFTTNALMISLMVTMKWNHLSWLVQSIILFLQGDKAQFTWMVPSPKWFYSAELSFSNLTLSSCALYCRLWQKLVFWYQRLSQWKFCYRYTLNFEAHKIAQKCPEFLGSPMPRFFFEELNIFMTLTNFIWN